MTLADFPQLQFLTPQEKLELLDELWKSLEVTLEEQQILDKRWEEFQRAPDTALTLEEFKERVRKLRA